MLNAASSSKESDSLFQRPWDGRLRLTSPEVTVIEAKALCPNPFSESSSVSRPAHRVIHQGHSPVESEMMSTPELVSRALDKTGYPLDRIHCHCDQTHLTLSGHVSRYFYLQIAVRVARHFSQGRLIELQVAVDDPV